MNTRYCLQQVVFLHRIRMFMKIFHMTQSETLSAFTETIEQERAKIAAISQDA
jgi:hypothetical protein